ncbi:SRPBCC family protein [Flagellimonas sp. S3867]|uniref:SRPBCC family protein n=1 Tax=Flagellimonas sp. S3867 TaxID=2768063 RepID=UPI001686A72E|nr:SRPBCC family protein [Flagellimonas sp. S3867]
MNKTIDISAPVVSNKIVLINASPENVWEVLINIDQWSTWQSDVTSSKLKGEFGLNSTFIWRSGGTKINSTIHTIEPFENFGWAGKTLGLLAVHNWKLIDIDGGTIVNVSESMNGFLAKLFKRQLKMAIEKGMQNWVDMLKIECEKTT